MLSKLTDAVTNRLGMKLLALVLALGVWFYASSRLREEVVITAEISIQPPAGYTIVHQSERQVRVRIAGPGSLIQSVLSVAEQGIRARHSLSADQVSDGWATVQIRPEWLQLALPDWELVQLRFLGISPRNVRVYTSPVVERQLPVRPVLVGSLPEGLRVQGEPQSVPAQVTVRGPAVAFEHIDAVPTEEVSLWDRRIGAYRERRRLQSVFEVPLGNGQRVAVALSLEHTAAEVTFGIAEAALEEKTWRNLTVQPMVPLGFPFQAQVEDGAAAVSVTVRGSPDAIRRLSAEAIRVFVDLAGLASESIEPGGTAPYRERVHVYVPPDVRAQSVRVEPDQVTILLKNPAQSVQ